MYRCETSYMFFFYILTFQFEKRIITSTKVFLDSLVFKMLYYLAQAIVPFFYLYSPW